MVSSANQGRDSIGKLVEEEEIQELLEYSHRTGMTEREIIYAEGSMTEWISAKYSLEVSEYR